MPTYQYHCEKCGFDMETIQRMTEAALTVCPNCNTSNLKRVIGVGGGFVLKGTGFYNTDYKNAPSPAKPVAQTPSHTTSSAEPKADTAKSETKPEPKSEAKADAKPAPPAKPAESAA
jgi:putative FmdB family regulatory protein